jgi:DNA-binding Lrp family transcriptional regulator
MCHRHIRTIREWHSGLLTDDEIAALAGPSEAPAPSSAEGDVMPPADVVQELARSDRLLLNALAEDGRCTYEELGRVAGVSEATARRRLGALRREGRVRIRAVIEPALVGLPVEALLRVRTAPAGAETVAAALADNVHVRYASFVTGAHQILVLAALPSESALYDFVTRAPWLRDVASVDTSLVLSSLKRGGMLARRSRTAMAPVWPGGCRGRKEASTPRCWCPRTTLRRPARPRSSAPDPLATHGPPERVGSERPCCQAAPVPCSCR